jgi:capsular exopolysaccharide synthesis family protein
MNMLYTLVGKEHHVVAITSPVSGEGKTTIAANLAVSCAMGGKNVLIIDGDMRRSCLRDIFLYDKDSPGLSDILAGNTKWQQGVLETQYSTLHVLPAGHLPPNPAELLGSNQMKELLAQLEQSYELIIMDLPPVNVVADPLAISSMVAGCLFVVRQKYTDHRDLRKALIAAEMTGMNVLGFIFFAEELTS